MKKAKIALRYCGGCNPVYDRTALVSKLKWDFPKLEMEPYSEPPEDYRGVLVICGCAVRCAEQRDLPTELPRFILNTSEAYEQATAFLCGLDKEI